MPASTAVTAKLSHRPVKPKGHSITISRTGNTRAVDTEIIEAATGFSMAERKLWVAKLNHRVMYVKLNNSRAFTAISK